MTLASMSKAAAAVALCAALAVCGSPSAKERTGQTVTPPAAAEESWSLTTWGELYEVFPETEPLVAGQVALSHTHVTVLADFSPLRTGTVSAVLRGSGTEQSFAGTFKRDGIFEIPFRAAREGTYDLAFRVDSAAGREEIPAGKVTVGTSSAPGALAEPPAPPHGAVPAGDATETSFLKEQQWKTGFATQWVREGSARHAVRGAARIRPIAGGEVVLTAPVDATVAGQPWPHVGLAVARGSAVFRLAPSVSSARSLPELAGDVSALQAEAGATRARADRLEALLKVEAVSRAEVERARAAATALEARLRAARQDLDAATAARTGSGAGTPLTVRAPWPGIVASVDVSPGQSVAAGTALGRLVKRAPLWLEVALRPEDAAVIGNAVDAVNVRRNTGRQAETTSLSNVRFVARAPEVDPRTGAQTLTLEAVDSSGALAIGSVVEAEIVLPGGRPGITVPASALVDDGGITVVYVQLSGEAFARREVRVVGRAGATVTVEGLAPGERLVTRGAASIRRASLLSTGAPEGHVH